MTCCVSCTKPLEQDIREERELESPSGSLLKGITPNKQGNKEKKFEDKLMEKISPQRKPEDIEKIITPWELKSCESKSLLMAMKVNFKLRGLAEKSGCDVGMFKQLANSVEEFSYRLLDPLKSDPGWCKQFGDKSLDYILDDAIELEQKKFLSHPAIHSEMNRKWKGREFMKLRNGGWKSWQLLLFNIWCLFDLVFSPILLAMFSLKKEWKVAEMYLLYLNTPYYKFVRDTLSYIVLLVLHFALCLTPSTIALSGIEWTILVFFVGRFLVECKQIWGIVQRLKRRKEKKGDRDGDDGGRNDEDDGAQSSCLKILSIYLSDCWNKLDFVSLVVFFITFILRVVTSVIAGSVTNNRTLVITGYLYSFNTLCLTLRAFGHVMEQSKDVGTIQIALFSILKDVRTVFWQFMAAILAFSFAMTKVYMSEKSFIANGSDTREIACKNSGISCWWMTFTHLGWSLLGVSEDLDPMAIVDLLSEILVRIFYASFLVMAVVLLVNLLIALLSNTYQRTEENAIKEWSFKRAVTIQTYDGYDPIPVPLNIIYRIFMLLRLVSRRKDETKPSSMLEEHIEDLEKQYFAEHANVFPVTDETKLDLVLQETERNRQMISQILSTVFESQDSYHEILRPGQKAWQSHPGIRIEGPLLTFECTESCILNEVDFHGARYRTRFSPEFPHFEVTVIEMGKTKWLGIGIVHEGYDINETMPGWESESVGYHTDDGRIFHNDNYSGMETEGPAMARRGDRIRCTVMFDETQERNGNGQVPVLFTLNGRKIITRGGESQFFMNCVLDNALFPFIGLSEGSSVLTKLCTKEDVDDRGSQLQDVKSDLADVGKHLLCAREDIVRQSLQMQEVKSDLAGIREEMCSREDVFNQFQGSLEEVKKITRSLEKKLDAILARLSEKE